MPESILRCRRVQCHSYGAGHHVHFIHAGRVGQHPWGWRDAVVAAVDGLAVHLTYLEHDARPICWHHRPLAKVLEPGAPVRLHEQYYVLGCPAGWFSVHIEDGIGAVPAPQDTGSWADQVRLGIVELRTGVAIPTDHDAKRGKP